MTSYAKIRQPADFPWLFQAAERAGDSNLEFSARQFCQPARSPDKTTIKAVRSTALPLGADGAFAPGSAGDESGNVKQPSPVRIGPCFPVGNISVFKGKSTTYMPPRAPHRLSPALADGTTLRIAQPQRKELLGFSRHRQSRVARPDALGRAWCAVRPGNHAHRQGLRDVPSGAREQARKDSLGARRLIRRCGRG